MHYQLRIYNNHMHDIINQPRRSLIILESRGKS